MCRRGRRMCVEMCLAAQIHICKCGVYVRSYLRVCLHKCIYIYIQKTYIHIYLYIYTYYKCICIYIYLFIYLFMDTHSPT